MDRASLREEVDLLRNMKPPPNFPDSDAAPKWEKSSATRPCWPCARLPRVARRILRGEITQRSWRFRAPWGSFAAKDFPIFPVMGRADLHNDRGWTVYELPPTCKASAHSSAQSHGAVDLEIGLNSTRALHVQMSQKARLRRCPSLHRRSRNPKCHHRHALEQYAADRAKLIDMDHAKCEVAPGTLVPDAGDTSI